jgi:hypothetical protein
VQDEEGFGQDTKDIRRGNRIASMRVGPCSSMVYEGGASVRGHVGLKLRP